jgi:hypothetical protein
MTRVIKIKLKLENNILFKWNKEIPKKPSNPFLSTTNFPSPKLPQLGKRVSKQAEIAT